MMMMASFVAAVWLVEISLAVPPVTIIGHRGNPSECPENTMVSFRSCVESGITWIETDLRLTKDGVVVLVHDASVNRTTNGGPVLVKDLLFSQITALDAGSWFSPKFKGEKVPSFDQLLSYLAPTNCSVVMDIKDHGIVEEISEVVKKWGFQQRVVASCWTDQDMVDFARYLPFTVRQKLGSFPLGVDERKWVSDQQALGYQSFSLAYQNATPALFSAVQSNFLSLVLWTVDDIAFAQAASDARVSGIITNIPLVLQAALSPGIGSLGLWRGLTIGLAIFSAIMTAVMIGIVLRFGNKFTRSHHELREDMHVE